MTSRGILVRQLLLSVGFAALGIWALAEAKYVSGAFFIVFSVSWLMFAAKGKIGATWDRRRARLQS